MPRCSERFATPGPVLLDVLTNADEVALPPQPDAQPGLGLRHRQVARSSWRATYEPSRLWWVTMRMRSVVRLCSVSRPCWSGAVGRVARMRRTCRRWCRSVRRPRLRLRLRRRPRVLRRSRRWRTRLCTRMNQNLVQIDPRRTGGPDPDEELRRPSSASRRTTCASWASAPALALRTADRRLRARRRLAATLAAARKAYDATKGEPSQACRARARRIRHEQVRGVPARRKLMKISGPAATVGEVRRAGAGSGSAGARVAGARGRQITREECERGTSRPRTKVLGAPAVFRRDGETAVGDLVCGWITANGVLYSSVRRVADAEAVIAPTRKAADLGVGPAGRRGLRGHRRPAAALSASERTRIVDLVPLPAGTANKDDMIAFALAMSPLYTPLAGPSDATASQLGYRDGAVVFGKPVRCRRGPRHCDREVC